MTYFETSAHRPTTPRERTARFGLLVGFAASAVWSAAVVGSVAWVLGVTAF